MFVRWFDRWNRICLRQVISWNLETEYNHQRLNADIMDQLEHFFRRMQLVSLQSVVELVQWVGIEFTIINYSLLRIFHVDCIAYNPTNCRHDLIAWQIYLDSIPWKFTRKNLCFDCGLISGVLCRIHFAFTFIKRRKCHLDRTTFIEQRQTVLCGFQTIEFVFNCKQMWHSSYWLIPQF